MPKIGTTEQQAILEINAAGVIFYGCILGSEPTLAQFLQAIPYTVDRRYAKMDNTRELLVFDPIGLWVLAEQRPALILAAGFVFEAPKWRQPDETDPKNCFTSSIRIGNVAFTPPIKRGLADKIAREQQGEISFFFVCQGQAVAGITIGFPSNDAKISVRRSK